MIPDIDSSIWEEVTLGDVITDSAFGPRFSSDLYNRDGNVGTIRTTDLNEEGIINYQTIPYANLPDNDFKNHYLDSGDLLITRSGTCGIPCIFQQQKKPIVAGAFLIRFVLRNDIVDTTYLHMLLKSSRIQAEILKMSSGGVQKNLTGTNLKKLKIKLPNLPEQKKIAKILSTWDKAITTTEQLIANSQQQKKALMQQLLTGKKRLAGFSGEWEEVIFGNVFKQRTEIGFINLPLISITSKEGVIDRESVGRKDTSNKDKTKYRRICPNDIGYNTMRMWQGVSGLSLIEGIVSPAYTILTPHASVDPKFASYLFKLPKLVHVFYRHSQGLVSDTWNLKYLNFAKIKWSLPLITEQQEIAQVLSNADQEIETLQQKLSFLKEEKKALMQQLLTGKRRVKLTKQEAENV